MAKEVKIVLGHPCPICKQEMTIRPVKQRHYVGNIRCCPTHTTDTAHRV